ncbi:SMC-Scp complex subunit ScpB [Gephyromycinifex aptenodytis]|uniref:SMC-Scp complex subunit ScpB n=1 Tax=Gephyromycinifex aptenodytis TaxID=2716227 RepID=UPI001446DA6C|nr:SMC-Scp complex subunit ScpB [Gephyromycinifex aptenodytis]
MTQPVEPTAPAAPLQEPADAGAEPRPVPEPPQEIILTDLPGGVRGAIEAVLMVIEEPVSEQALAEALELPVEEVCEQIAALVAEYDRQERGFTLRRTEAGWRVYSRHEYAPVVERFLLEGRRAKLSRAALETLAVIAYRQPISRARVGAVRGVNVDGVVRTLLTRGLIEESGTDGEHGAVLYGTTDDFLVRLGLGSLEELPPLAPYLPDAHQLEDIERTGA